MIKFKSQATAEVILLETSAQQVLRLIGKEPGPQGIITVEQMPAAMAALEQAVHEEDERRREARAAGVTMEHLLADADEPHAHAATTEGSVTLRQRVAPLLDMLRRSAAEGKDVVWGV